MPVYEMRTYNVQVGKMAEVVKVYQEFGWPAIQKVGPEKLVGYFMSDVGALNQLVHLWKFDDDADRRKFWQTAYALPDFQAFGGKIRPMILCQENRLLQPAPWGPQP